MSAFLRDVWRALTRQTPAFTGRDHRRAAERQAAYDEGRWCGECIYGVVMDPPCCTGNPEATP